MSDSPTAVHAVGDAHDTLLRKVNLYSAPPGLGVRWIVHVEPFHLSTSDVATVVPLPEVPTAMHAADDVHDTPYSPGAASTAAEVGAARGGLERADECA